MIWVMREGTASGKSENDRINTVCLGGLEPPTSPLSVLRSSAADVENTDTALHLSRAVNPVFRRQILCLAAIVRQLISKTADLPPIRSCNARSFTCFVCPERTRRRNSRFFLASRDQLGNAFLIRQARAPRIR